MVPEVSEPPVLTMAPLVTIIEPVAEYLGDAKNSQKQNAPTAATKAAATIMKICFSAISTSVNKEIFFTLIHLKAVNFKLS